MNTSDFKDISYQKDQYGIVTLTFNTPKRKNALSLYSFYEIYQAIDALENDASAHAMIITGAVQDSDQASSEAYSSGGYFNADAFEGLAPDVLAELDQNDIAQKRTTLKMFNCDKPIIAAINGLAIGGAVTLTLAGADQIYMSEHAWLQLPFAKLGISAELASSFLLPRLLGMHAAKQIMFFAERIDAESAQQFGLANAIIPHTELLDYAHQQARRLVPPMGAGLAIREMKKLLHTPLEQQLSDALDRENNTLQKLFASADFSEGVAARIERREPQFSGR